MPLTDIPVRQGFGGIIGENAMFTVRCTGSRAGWLGLVDLLAIDLDPADKQQPCFQA